MKYRFARRLAGFDDFDTASLVSIRLRWFRYVALLLLNPAPQPGASTQVAGLTAELSVFLCVSLPKGRDCDVSRVSKTGCRILN